jgi:hypothetical protein
MIWEAQLELKRGCFTRKKADCTTGKGLQFSIDSDSIKPVGKFRVFLFAAAVSVDVNGRVTDQVSNGL